MLIYESGIMCRPEFENGGLREWLLTENGGFQSGPSLKNEGISELELAKKCIFLKRGFFRSSPG